MESGYLFLSNPSEAFLIEQMILVFHRLVIVDPNKTIVPVSEFFGEGGESERWIHDGLWKPDIHAVMKTQLRFHESLNKG